MPDKVIDTRQLEQFLGKLEKLPKQSIPIMEEAMQEAVKFGLSAVIDRTPVAYGNLRGEIHTQVQASEQGVTGIVGTSVPYAVWVEEDTRPHWAPLEPLIDWVKKKQIAGVYSVQSRRRLGGKAKIDAENIALARMVQKKIAMKGTTGQHMFRDGLAASDEEINRIFERAVEKVIALLME
jgi:hypothetical protein